MSKRKKLYLIDGSNYVFRAYYAIPHLSNSKGMPTNALLGFTQMLLKLLKDENPEYIGVTFDTKEPTFRKELYNAYKANRPEPPEDLVPQFPYFPKIVKAFDIQVLIKPGFEADDVIGTMTKSAVEDGFDVVIMTGDKDMMQLVNEHVSIWDAMKNKTIGIKEVEEKFGVKPDRVIDVLGLSGDASDNIPGVSGVGPKTATKLITEFGSVEGVIENVDKLKGKLKDRFKENIDKARLSKKLVTIKTDVPLEIKPRDLKYNGYERDALVNVLDEFEFKRLRLELTEKKEETGTSYKIITSEEELHELISVIKKVGKFAFYTQASHDNPWWGSVVGIAISCQIGSAFYIPMAHIGLDAANQIHAKSALAALKVVFEDKNIVKYGHNMKRSMALFKMYDLKLKGQLIDSMVVSYVLKPTGKHSIVDIAENILNTSLAKREDTVGKGKKEINFQALELKIANDFMSQRADYLFRICEQLFPELDKSDQKNVYYDIEMSLIDILSDMESYGVLVD
ncbi:DNA polymerase I, partial [bacterium]|nr:DNA polymerase I [bacterium]